MTDPWDEKPDAELEDGISGIVAYESTEMDAWLVKVKELYDIYVKQYRNMAEHALEQQNKLEAVRKVYQDILDYDEDDCGVHPMYPLRAARDELQKILEGDSDD